MLVFLQFFLQPVRLQIEYATDGNPIPFFQSGFDDRLLPGPSPHLHFDTLKSIRLVFFIDVIARSILLDCSIESSVSGFIGAPMIGEFRDRRPVLVLMHPLSSSCIKTVTTAPGYFLYRIFIRQHEYQPNDKLSFDRVHSSSNSTDSSPPYFVQP
jgi:hypothetical protein